MWADPAARDDGPMTAVLAAAALVAIWFAMPLLIAPLALVAVVLGGSSRTGRRRAGRRRTTRRLDVHSLPTVHPTDDERVVLVRAA